MAGMVGEQVIEEIRNRTDIVEVIGARVSLKRSGTDFTACCPFHNERTPSFHVNPSRQSYKCFGCGEGGDVFKFLMKHDGLTFGDALRNLAERCGVKLAFEEDDGQGHLRKRLLQLHAELAAFYRHCLLKSPDAAAGRTYLASRDLPEAIVEQFQLGFAPTPPRTLERWATEHKFTTDEMVAGGILTAVERDGKQAFHDRFRGRLMFPITDTQGRVVAFSARILEKDAKAAKYVNSPETPIFSKSRTLFALDKAQRSIVSAPNRQAILCEGQIDVIRCHAAGFGTAVASQGTAFTEEHVRLLKRYADSAMLVFDPDAAGQKAAVRTAGMLLAAAIPVRIARLPEGEDPDAFLRQRGADAFRKVLAQAEEIVPFQARLLQALEPDPRASDAVGRVSRGLLETIRQCSNAVQRARMLQEAAALLDIPANALEEELTRLIEAEARRVARRTGTEAGDAARKPQLFAEQAREEANALLVPDNEMPSGATVAVDGAGAGREAAMHAPRPEEYRLCEMLVHHSEDPTLVHFVDAHVPLALFRHPHCRLIAGAVFESLRQGKDELLALQETAAPDIVEFIRRIVVSPIRSGTGDFTQMEAARGLVLALWRRNLIDERKALEVTAADPGRADQERRRAQLAMELRKLDDWEHGVHVIGRARARSAGVTEAVPEPLPAGGHPPSPATVREAKGRPYVVPNTEPMEPVDDPLPEW